MFLSSMVVMISDRQVMSFSLVSSLFTSLRVTGLKDIILGRSFGKVLGTLTQSAGLNDLHIVSILSEKNDAKPSASDASEPDSIGFPPRLFSKEVQESKQFPLVTMDMLYSCIHI